MAAWKHRFRQRLLMVRWRGFCVMFEIMPALQLI
jgi:hypothetical protein